MRGMYRAGLLGATAALLLGCNLEAGGLGDVTSAGSSAADTTGPTTSGDTTNGGTASGGGSSGGSTTAVDTTSPGTQGSSDSGDGSSDSTTGEPEPEPWPQGQFDPPVRVDMLSLPASNDDDPSLTDDRLEIVFNSNRFGSYDIFWSSRASVLDDWDPPVSLGAVNNPAIENTPELSGDGLVLMFGSSRPNVVGDLDVYISYRENRAASWSVPQLVEDLSTAFEDFAPTLSLGLEEIYVCSNRPRGVPGQNIFSASVSQNAGVLSFGGLQPVAELNSSFDDCTAFVSPDRRTIFFDTSRDDGLLDLYVATRDEPGQPFESLQPVDELNNAFAYDGDPWLSSDGHVIYFSSTRDNGLQDIYYAVR